jgi:UDP-N-acetylglucosamine--N-acetylmuramyl-(pentapeptide) pyrophosphoryl-undecaprenol N-acetylglucosamine transferase
MSRRILIMAGGTGGHVYPALAVAHELQRRGADVRWLGTRQGLEATVVPDAGITLEFISIGGVRGKGVFTWILAPFKLALAIVQALMIVARYRPSSVLGMGGFVAGPGGIASYLLRRPLLIHEQNAIAGMTNRWLSRLARKVMEGFPGSFPEKVQTEHVGNPVRDDISQLPPPGQRLADRRGPLRLLVLGGSLGAVVLNEMIPQALKSVAEDLRPQVKHQCGTRNLAQAQQAYAATGIDAEVVPYIKNMAEAYGWADLVICRAGALTLAELTAAGVASVLVPFPHAVDDHQTLNARYLESAGAAELIPQEKLNVATLVQLIEGFARDRTRVIDMAEAARRLAHPDACRRVAELCLEAAA